MQGKRPPCFPGSLTPVVAFLLCDNPANRKFPGKKYEQALASPMPRSSSFTSLRGCVCCSINVTPVRAATLTSDTGQASMLLLYLTQGPAPPRLGSMEEIRVVLICDLPAKGGNNACLRHATNPRALSPDWHVHLSAGRRQNVGPDFSGYEGGVCVQGHTLLL